MSHRTAKRTVTAVSSQRLIFRPMNFYGWVHSKNLCGVLREDSFLFSSFHMHLAPSQFPDLSHCPRPFLTSSWKQVASLWLSSLIPQRVFESSPPPQSSSSAHQIRSRSSPCARQQAGGVELSEGVTGRGFLHSRFKKP